MLPLDPWVIERMEEERRRRESEAVPSTLEVPMTPHVHKDAEPDEGDVRVRILDISPPHDNAIEI